MTEEQKVKVAIEGWIKKSYPFAKYTNALSFKWVVKFAIYYKNLKK